MRVRRSVAGSSSSAWTASAWVGQAPTGSSSTAGPAGSSIPLPAGEEAGEPLDQVADDVARRPALDRGRCRPSRRHRRPARRTCRRRPGDGRPARRAASSLRPRPRSSSASSLAYPSSTPVSMPDASQASRSAKLSTSDWACSRVRPSPRSSNRQRLQGDAVGLALPGEGLHDPVGADLVEAAAEARPRSRRGPRRSASCRRRGRPSSRSWWSSTRGPPTGRRARGRCGPGAAARGWRRSRG